MKINNQYVSHIAMTAAERANGRYMRAPDHPRDEGGGGDTDEGGGGDESQADPEPSGEEVNDSVLDEGTSEGDRQAPEDAEDDPAPKDGEGDGEGEKPKSVEERIGELTGQLREMQRINAERDRDLEYWVGRAQGTIDEEGNPIGQQQPPESRTITPDDPDRPDPSKYQYGETDSAYITDLARYEANKAYEEREAKEEVKKALQTVESTHSERVSKVKERLANYDDIVVKGADPDPVTGQPKWAASPLLTLGIKTSDYGPDIAYHLASNPEESFRIAKLPPIEQAREFGRLEYRMELEAQSRGEGSEQSTNRRTSSAPNPPPRARGGGGRSEIPDDTDDFAAFEQKADAAIAKKSRRRRR